MVDSNSIAATLQPDRKTIHLDEEIALPPGKVTVSVHALDTRSGPTMLEVLERIHQQQIVGGRVTMTEEEMAKEIEAIRADDEEYDKRWREIWLSP